MGGHVDQDAPATMVITSEDPPNEMNGSGMPVTGSKPITAPM